MNENEKPRNDRRRSSRRRGGRSGRVKDEQAQGAVAARSDSLPRVEAASRPSIADRLSPLPAAKPAAAADKGRASSGRRTNRRKASSDGAKPVQTERGRGSGGNPRNAPRSAPSVLDAEVLSPEDAAKRKALQRDRPRWTPPRPLSAPLPKPSCPRCGKSIEDLPTAVNDSETGKPMHFDCAVERLTESERLSEGDRIVYIGGGRFAVAHFDDAQDSKSFRIKKTIVWEVKEKRAEWRKEVADQYSST